MLYYLNSPLIGGPFDFKPNSIYWFGFTKQDCVVISVF
jgi:hypothetical protein